VLTGTRTSVGAWLPGAATPINNVGCVSQDAIRVVERYCQASGTLVGTVQVEEQVFRRDDNTELDSIWTIVSTKKPGKT
jgi:hypothetical protein